MNYRAKRKLNLTLVYVILAILACIWVFPIIWIVLTSFRAEGGAFVPYIIPKQFTLDNYAKLLTNPNGT